jgi:hypothetical protein
MPVGVVCKLVQRNEGLVTGDAAHFKDNWDNDRVPSMNTSTEHSPDFYE